MYTGIIRAMFPAVSIEEKDNLRRLGIKFSRKMCKGLHKGDSVSVAGVCLTVSDFKGRVVFFDAMKETLEKTSIGLLQINSLVNIERSAKIGEEIGGHSMAGHIYGMAKIIKREDSVNNVVMTFLVPADWMKYILEKGFVGIDGCSLTVTNANKTAGTFEVYFIAETLKITTFGERKNGDFVNIEIDHTTQTIVETVEKIISEKYGS